MAATTLHRLTITRCRSEMRQLRHKPTLAESKTAPKAEQLFLYGNLGKHLTSVSWNIQASILFTLLDKNSSDDLSFPMAIPSLNGMRAFEVAARLGSIKDAAEELHLTPSAVSRHIRTLEKTLGLELFERGFRQVTPTMRGSYYARSLSEAFEAIWRATEDVGLYDGRHKMQRVKLMCEPTFLNLWLADRLPAFRRQHSTVDLEISTSGKRSNVDFAIVDEFVYKAGATLTMMVPLLLTPVCAPSLLDGPIPLRSPVDLVHHHLIHECETTRWKKWLQQEGVSDLRSASGSTLHDCTLIMREVVNGMGIALADTIMAQDLLLQGKLVAPFAARHAYPAGYYLQQRRSIGNKPSARLFQDWLLSEIAEHKKVMGIRLG